MRVHLVSGLVKWGYVWWLVAIGCGRTSEEQGGSGEPPSLTRGAKDIDELQRIAHTPRAARA